MFDCDGNNEMVMSLSKISPFEKEGLLWFQFVRHLEKRRINTIYFPKIRQFNTRIQVTGDFRASGKKIFILD